jgi:hypothetical protein
MKTKDKYLDALAEAVYWRCRVTELLETDHVESAKVLDLILGQLNHDITDAETERVLNQVCELVRAYDGADLD